MLSTFAATAPIAMASRVRSASTVGRWPVNAPVGSPRAAPTPVIVAEAAPAISRIAQDRNSPRPAQSAIAFLLVSGGK